MNDEIDMIKQARPEVTPYSEEAKLAARRTLTASAPPRRRPYGIALVGALAVAAASVVAVATLFPGAGADDGPTVAVGTASAGTGERAAITLPRIAKMSAEEVLGRAARAVTDLRPGDDQFIRVTSQTMYGAFRMGANVKTGESIEESRYLYRSKRTIWLSADGTRDGALKIEYLEPRAYPGWPIPKEAYDEQGTEWNRLPVCGNVSETAYTSLKKLPGDAEGMRAHLYARDNGDNSPDAGAWTAVGDLLRETYLPAAQRAALFKAAATIPGVTVTEDAEDAAGRKGIGVGRESLGIREDIIFNPETYELLGERGIVVDEKEAKAPLGSLVASTAQLTISVDDKAPRVDDPHVGCG
ncbi:CU044_5270 family protein [Microtetraspora sp. AC03309]|uniref:CU044_5270 family protein n=1 Tax=Microtetraspora sp. AC03309 TaxID=2779376 RepID=UPI001E4C76F3|nr:CU044_5270 family protein [Microtetraspora sp. AC03309]MCC5575192.1 CU044_5270 family protein [Microtetraspora sp. AC03309]